MDIKIKNILENLPGGISNNKIFQEYQKDIIYNNLNDYNITMSNSYFNKIALLFPNIYSSAIINNEYDHYFVQIKTTNTGNNKFYPKILIYSCINKKDKTISNLSITNINDQIEQNIKITQTKNLTELYYETRNKSIIDSNNIESINLTFDRDGHFVNNTNNDKIFDSSLFKSIFNDKSDSIEYLMTNKELDHSKLLQELCYTEFNNHFKSLLSINLPRPFLNKRFQLIDAIEIINIEQEIKLYINKHNLTLKKDIIQNLINNLLLFCNLNATIIFQKCFIDILFSNQYFKLDNIDFYAFLLQDNQYYYLKINTDDSFKITATQVPKYLLDFIYKEDSNNSNCELLKTIIES